MEIKEIKPATMWAVFTYRDKGDTWIISENSIACTKVESIKKFMGGNRVTFAEAIKEWKECPDCYYRCIKIIINLYKPEELA